MINVENISNTMKKLALDGRNFEIIVSECGASVVPSLYAYKHIEEFNSEALALRQAIPGLTVHNI